jgi:hypothetical protein
MWRTVLAVVLVGCAAVVAACSSSSSSSGSDFTTEANNVCLKQAKQVQVVSASPVGAEATKQQAVAAETKYVKIQNDYAKALSKIHPPADKKAQWDKFVSQRKQLAKIQADVVAAAKKSKDAFAAASAKQGKVGAASLKTAAGLKLDACSHTLPADQKKTVVATVTKNETVADPAQCTDYFTANAVKLGWKNMAGCRKFQTGEGKDQVAKSVKVKIIDGVDNLYADASVSFNGGINDGKTLTYGMLYQDGKWKVNSVSQG